jgi:hypothetical protein
MPVKIGTLLNNLAKKAGYNTESPEFTDILSANLEIPDELNEALNSRLLTEESAKNSPALKKHFRSSILDGVDKNILSLFDEFEFDDATRQEITGIENTYERIPALAKKIRDLEGQKASAGKTDKAQLQEQINRLNQEKAQLIKQYDDQIKSIRQEAQNEITTTLFRNSLAEVDLAEDQFDRETMLTLAEQRLNKELAAQGAKVVNKNGVLTLVQASDEALDFYKDNKLVSYRDFRDQVLSSAKIIKVNKPAGQTGTQTSNGNTSQTTTAQAAPVNNSLLAKIEQAKAAFVKTGS